AVGRVQRRDGHAVRVHDGTGFALRYGCATKCQRQCDGGGEKDASTDSVHLGLLFLLRTGFQWADGRRSTYGERYPTACSKMVAACVKIAGTPPVCTNTTVASPGTMPFSMWSTSAAN